MVTGKTINNARKIYLPQITNSQGNLSFVEQHKHIPFKVRTASWIYGNPDGGELEGYSVKESCEFIIAISGDFQVILNDGYKEMKFLLNRPYLGLHIPAMIWRKIENFSTDSIAFILSSADYFEDNYVRDFENFLSLKKYDNQ